jgi:hypothetical protein
MARHFDWIRRYGDSAPLLPRSIKHAGQLWFLGQKSQYKITDKSTGFWHQGY